MQLKPPAGVNRVVENGCLDGMGLMGNRRGDGGLGGGACSRTSFILLH